LKCVGDAQLLKKTAYAERNFLLRILHGNKKGGVSSAFFPDGDD
jgi:hypothetical protein